MIETVTVVVVVVSVTMVVLVAVVKRASAISVLSLHVRGTPSRLQLSGGWGVKKRPLMNRMVTGLAAAALIAAMRSSCEVAGTKALLLSLVVPAMLLLLSLIAEITVLLLVVVVVRLSSLSCQEPPYRGARPGSCCTTCSFQTTAAPSRSRGRSGASGLFVSAAPVLCFLYKSEAAAQ